MGTTRSSRSPKSAKGSPNRTSKGVRKRPSVPKGTPRRWTLKDKRTLWALRDQEDFLTHGQIGRQLGRTDQACRLKLHKLKKDGFGASSAANVVPTSTSSASPESATMQRSAARAVSHDDAPTFRNEAGTR